MAVLTSVPPQPPAPALPLWARLLTADKETSEQPVLGLLGGADGCQSESSSPRGPGGPGVTTSR